MIFGIGGKLSGGKTVSLVRFAHHYGLKGKKVIGNIKLNFPNNIKTEYMGNETFVDFLKYNLQKPQVLHNKFFNSVLILDEIVNLVSARRTSTALNEMVTNFLMMVGKLDTHVGYSFQVRDSHTDIRLRNVTNIYGNCYRVDEKGQVLMTDDRIVDKKIFIVLDLELDFDLRGIKIVQDVFDPEPYFHLYNTREITLLDRTRYLRGGIKDLRKR